MSLSGRRIVLGVCGGVSAYKSVEVCRRLTDLGAYVTVVMTKNAQRFVGKTTFSALASEPVRTSLWSDHHGSITHTSLGQKADLVLICPATARVLGSYRGGIADDLLTNVLLATRAPVLVAPAMHTEMWENPATQENVRVLRERNVAIVGPESGELAGGDIGVGRLADPETVVAAATELLIGRSLDMVGISVLVTAGGTREPIDPVRFITNRSSGKQGHAIAVAAAQAGADVELITTAEAERAHSIEVTRVETASEMHRAVLERSGADIVVMCAAVADFRPKSISAHKVKKSSGLPVLELEPTVDIVAELAKSRRPGQQIVGFAAETRDVIDNARSKLVAKGLDFIVANDVSAAGVGFGHDTNAVTIIGSNGICDTLALASKTDIASAVLERVVKARDEVPRTPSRNQFTENP